MSDTRFRVAVIGLGDIASVHGEILERHPQFELVGGSDLSAAARSAFGERFGVPTVESLDELLDLGIDVLIVAVPNKFHAPYTIAALRRGVLVLCEKPPALTAAEAQEMADAAERFLPLLQERFPEAAGNLLYGLVYRHTIHKELDFVSPEFLGAVPIASAEWERVRGVPGRGGFTNLALSGGGALMDLGIHILDLTWWLLRRPRPIGVWATTSNVLGRQAQVQSFGEFDATGFEVEDTAKAFFMFEHESGVLIPLSLTAAFAGNVPGGVLERVRIELRGANAGTELFPHTPNQRGDLSARYTTEQYGSVVVGRVSEPPPLTVQQGYVRQIDHMAAVLAGATPIVTPEDGVTVMRMVDAAYESSRTGLPVLLSD